MMATMPHLAGIQFKILTAEDIKNIGVVEVTESTTHNKGIPKAGGPADTRFGTCSRFFKCGTCKNTVLECPGHPGYISLTYPLPHVAFAQKYLSRIINLYCYSCSAYLLPDLIIPKDIKTVQKRLTYIYEESKRARCRKRNPLCCPECNVPQPLIRVEEPFFKTEWPDDVLDQFYGPDVTRKHGYPDNGTKKRSISIPFFEGVDSNGTPKRKKTKRSRASSDIQHAEEETQKNCMDYARFILNDEDWKNTKPRKLSESELSELYAKRRNIMEERYLYQQYCLHSDIHSENYDEPLTDEERMTLEIDFTQRSNAYMTLVKRKFTNWDAYNVLRSIKKEDLTPLGINGEHTHPSGFMILNLLVPAIGVRPSVSFEEGSSRRGYHHHTRKLGEIIKLKRNMLIEASNSGIDLTDQFYAGPFPDSLIYSIQYLYVTISNYISKDKCKVPGFKLSPYALRANARSTSVAQVLSGKRGRYRENVMGKRVNFCLRTVATPSANSDIDEIGVPYELAQRLTIPIRINSNNRTEIKHLVSAGKVSQLMDDATGEMIAIGDHNKDTIPLLDGWIAERFLQDGDYIPINRQPTLHRPSIMGHRIKIHHDKTLKLPYSATQPYNADFDGDEMNGHVPQTLQARAEVQELLALPNHIIHPRGNRPVIALIQDALDSGYYMTRQGVYLTRADACSLLMSVHYDCECSNDVKMGDPKSRLKNFNLPMPAIVHPQKLWTGSQIFSMIIPSVVNIDRKLKNRKQHPDSNLNSSGRLYILNGNIIMGTLCKQSLGGAPNDIIHQACLYSGGNVAARFISDAQRLLNKYFIRVGFSIGVNDFILPKESQKKIRYVLDRAKDHIANIMKKVEGMETDIEIMQLAEEKISNTLKSLLHMVGNVVRSQLDDTNTFNVMANIVGSKGSGFNLAQVMGLVGQTFVNGLRPDAEGADRVLPSQPLSDQPSHKLQDNLASRGLHIRPYKMGLRMPDAFLHCMGGREGLVDTAAKTSRTGYIQRRLVKAQESQHIAQDGTVRDAYNTLFQHFFGGDGLNPMKTLRVSVKDFLVKDNETLRNTSISQKYKEEEYMTSMSEWKTIENCRENLRYARQNIFQRNIENSCDVYIPFDIAMLIRQAQYKCPCNETLASPVYTFESVNELCERLQSDLPCLHTIAHIWDTMNTARICDSKRPLCKKCVRNVCDRVYEMHVNARIEAGEGVGAMTATSIGEPLSQMTLNSFHHAGSANKGMTHGVPRMKEIIGATKKIATPYITLGIRNTMPNPNIAATALSKTLPFTLLRNIVYQTHTVYEPDIKKTHIKEDEKLINQHLPFLDYIKDRCSSWIVRFHLCKTKTSARSLEPRGVADLIQSEIQDGGIVISSMSKDENWIIRIYLLDLKPTIEQALTKALDKGTTRSAAKRASQQRLSLSTKKRRKYADLSRISTDDECPNLDVPLHCIDPHIERTKHSAKDVIEWMICRNQQQDLMSTLCVAGIKDIDSAIIRNSTGTKFNKDTGAVESFEETLIDVRGSNLVECALLPGVDQRRIVTNHILEVFDVAGITAASHVLYNELRTCLSASGARVDERLIKLVVDVMTHNGVVMSISRHGLNRLVKHGVMAKITFEETLEMLFEAAAFGYFDPLLGVSENIMVGRQVNIGTNLSKIVNNGDDVMAPKNKILTMNVSDTRVVCSIVTEENFDVMIDTDNNIIEAAREEKLNALVSVQNSEDKFIKQANSNGGEPITTKLYRQDWFHQPQTENILQTKIVDPPFRPSSPPLVDQTYPNSTLSESIPFRPTSPDVE